MLGMIRVQAKDGFMLGISRVEMSLVKGRDELGSAVKKSRL